MTDINREVAEKVMGAKSTPYPNWWLRGEDWYFLPDGVPAYWECYVYFNPKERIDHAWMVVEKFRKQGYWVHIFGRPEHYSCGMAHLKDTTKNDVLQQADTAPMAICLASLEAVKEGRNEGKV